MASMRRRAVGWQRRHTERTGRQAVGVGHHQRAGDLGVFCSTAAVAAGDDARAVIDRGDGDGDGGRFGHAAAGHGVGEAGRTRVVGRRGEGQYVVGP
ncbi:MAG: hypothetical protein MZV63_14910 [Marinilabiliales bacterium]|nr:hypothetical protein [Marinilabiliales bacterium]